MYRASKTEEGIGKGADEKGTSLHCVEVLCISKKVICQHYVATTESTKSQIQSAMAQVELL